MADLTFYFIVEGRKLEAQALFLADSLRQHHPDEHQIIAYVPERYIADLSPFTRAFLTDRRVKITPLATPEGTWRRPYPHGNKILATAEPRSTRHSIFLDTDMCLCRPLDFPPDADDNTIHVVPEGVRTWGADLSHWQRAYAFFDLPFPEDRVRLVRWGKKEFVPYFNAGFVAFPEAEITDGKRFGELWLDTAQDFDFNAKIRPKRPWLDQITLPLTIKRFGMEYNVLPDAYNFSTKNRKYRGERPYVAHYHRAASFAKMPFARPVLERFEQAMRDFPLP